MTRTAAKKKHVTWSPVVAPVHRPVTKTKRVRTRKTTISFTQSDGTARHVKGTLIAHARRDTHSLLLTIRNKHHRDMQLLIDLPRRRLRKIYDGHQSWTVDENAADTLAVACNPLGTVLWKDDNTVRKADARGFFLSWLNNCPVCPVRTSKKSLSTTKRPASRKRLGAQTTRRRLR